MMRLKRILNGALQRSCIKGNIASYTLNAKKFVSLMFHKGALINDKSSLLEGEGKEVRVAKFTDPADIRKKKKALESVIKEWIKMQDKSS